MSVVNKMLKDLENRDVSSTAQANYKPPLKKKGLPLRPLLLTLCGILLILAVWLWPESPAPRITPAITPINQEPTTAKSTDPVQSAKPSAPQTVAATTATTDEESQGSTLEPEKLTVEEQVELDSSAAGNTLSNQTSEATSKESVTLIEINEAPVDVPVPSASSLKKTNAKSQPGSLKERIDLAIADKNTTQAITLLRTLILQQPDNLGAKKRLAALLFSEGRVSEAQQLLQQAVDEFPADSSVRLMYARLLQQQNEANLAFYALQDIQDYARPSIELLGYRASLAQSLGNYTDALADYSQLVTIDGQNAKWWLGQAVVADKQGQLALAINSYRTAIELQQLGNDVDTFMRQRLATLLRGAS